MKSTHALSQSNTLPKEHRRGSHHPMESSLCQVPAQTPLVTWKSGLGDPARGRRPGNKRSGGAHGNKLPLSSLKHGPGLSGQEAVGVNEGQMEAGLTKTAGASSSLSIPQLPSFPISAPDLRLEAEVPKPLSPL